MGEKEQLKQVRFELQQSYDREAALQFQIDTLRDALREALPYMHRHMRVVAPGMRDDGHVMTFHERDCHEYVDEHHICVGCELEKRIGQRE